MELEIISGFLGAGKTTFINKYIPLLPKNIAIIENEFGKIGLDGDLIQADNIKEIYAGCICCSLRGDFEDGILDVYNRYKPEKIIIEPSGVGRLSDIIKACKAAIKSIEGASLTKLIVIVDASSYFEFKEDFGPFFMDQIHHANIIFLSHLSEYQGDMDILVKDIKTENKTALFCNVDFNDLDANSLLELINSQDKVKNKILKNISVPENMVFSSFSKDTFSKSSLEELRNFLDNITSDHFGSVLRVKGICSINNESYKFDYTKTSTNIVKVEEGFASKIIVIGLNLDDSLKEML